VRLNIIRLLSTTSPRATTALHCPPLCKEGWAFSFSLSKDRVIAEEGAGLLLFVTANMGSLRTLFLAVYASNGVIRTLFLPLCYLTLFSPFTLALAWYFGFVQAFQNAIPEEFSWFDLLPTFAISAVFVLLPTRLLSSSAKVSKGQNGKRRVQSLPYWIPGVRHLWSIAFGGEEWLKSVR
jgi:hypothetical protein